MELEKMIELKDTAIYYMDRLSAEDLQTVCIVARNLHRNQRPGVECISALVTQKSTPWYREGIARVSAKLQDHKHLVAVYNFICRCYAQEP